MKSVNINTFDDLKIAIAMKLLEDVEKAERELDNFMETNSSLEDLEMVRKTLEEIKNNDYNLNISRYVSTATAEEPIDLIEISKELTKIEDDIQKAKAKHNQFLKELGLPELK